MESKTSIRKVIFLSFLIASSGFAKKIDVGEYLNLVEQANSELKSLRSHYQVALENVRVAKNNLWPSLSFEGGLIHEVDSQDDDTDQVAYLSLDYTLADFGRRAARIKKNEVHAQVDKIQIDIAKARILSSIKIAYYRYILLKRQLVSLNQVLKRNAQQIRDVRKRLASGRATRSDIVEFQLAQSQFQSQAINTKKDIKILKLQLLSLADISEPNIEFSDELDHVHIGETFSEVESSLLSSLKFELENKEIAAAKSKYDGTRATSKPRLDLEVDAGLLEEPDLRLNENRPGVEAKLMIRWDLTPGLFRNPQKKVAYHALEAQKHKKNAEIKRYSIQMTSRYHEIISIQERHDLENKRRQKARELYKLVYNDYRKGVKSSGELAAASVQIFDAENTEGNLKLAFYTQLLELEVLLGRKIKTEEHHD